MVNDQNTVEYRKVELGPMSDGLRVVRNGLKPEDWVIVNGVQRVRTGAKVDAERQTLPGDHVLPTPAPLSPSHKPAGARLMMHCPTFSSIDRFSPPCCRSCVVIAGAIAYFTLPIAQYPEVVPPTVVVRASYPGANPQVIADTVATPMEQQINGVEDMLYMSSQSTSDGQMALTITFKLGTNLDKAQVLVQNRVAIAEPILPEEVRRGGVTTTKSSPDLLLVAHLLSPDDRYDQPISATTPSSRCAMCSLASTVSGMFRSSARANIACASGWIPRRLRRNMTASDVVQALREQMCRWRLG